MRILNNNWKLLSRYEMQELKSNLPIDHGWKNTHLLRDFYIIPPDFIESDGNILSFDISQYDIETLAEDIANIQLDILFGNTEES